MLTKQELTQKKAQDTRQLDLVEEISSEDRLRRKRLILYITIILTIGLSLAFWLYRSVKNIRFSLPSLPHFTAAPAVRPKSSLDPGISGIIGGDSGWSISTGPDPLFNWTSNRQNYEAAALAKIKTDLLSAKTDNKDSLVRNSLPEGLTVREKLISHDNNFTLYVLVVTPQKEIVMVLSDDNTDQDNFKSAVVNLVPVLYWHTTL